MTAQFKVRRVGNSLGLILGKDVLDELGVREGDVLFLTKTSEGFTFTPYDPDFAEAVESNRDYMRRHRNALKELSKR